MSTEFFVLLKKDKSMLMSGKPQIWWAVYDQSTWKNI